MRTALVLSIFVKGLGALLEIAIQVLITRFGSVELFGTYSFYVSVVEIVCWIFFSGIVKLNNFYIANGYNLSGFKRNYFFLYCLPIVIVLILVSVWYSSLMILAMVAACLYALQMDLSSICIACRKYKSSLFGEYLLSRIFIFVGVCILIVIEALNERNLVLLYAGGFLVSVVFFTIVRPRLKGMKEYPQGQGAKDVAKKYKDYQLVDVANGLIGQAPVIVQYIFSGAYQAGILSVILVAKKVISFIAGPTSKIYLPEFAKRYGDGDMEGLRETYREVVVLQLCFVLPLLFVMLSVPDALLYIYNSELVEYQGYLRLACVVFFFLVVFGPQGNFLDMIDKGYLDAATKWLSLAVMVVVMALTFENDMFVIYGISAQVIFEAFAKQFFVSKELGGVAIHAVDAVRFVVPFVALLVPICLLSTGMMWRLVFAVVAALALCVLYLFVFFKDAIFTKLKETRH